MDYGILDSFWFILLYAVCETAAMVLAARVLLHYFQLESYQFRGYFKTILRQWKRAFAPGIILSAVFGVFMIIRGNELMQYSYSRETGLDMLVTGITVLVFGPVFSWVWGLLLSVFGELFPLPPVFPPHKL